MGVLELLCMKLKHHLRENIYKNILIILFALLFYPLLKQSLDEINLDQTGNLLLVISMFLVTVCFANFEFTYEKSQLDNKLGKWLATSSTAIFMFLIALLLETIILIIQLIYPSFFGLFLGFSILLYSGIIIYDFWDLIRTEHR